MRAAAALALLAAGAILTFAVSARVPAIDLRLTGVILLATGVAALLVPARPPDWRRGRRGRHDPAEPAAAESDDDDYPAYLLQDPAVLAAEVLNGMRADRETQAGSEPGAGGWAPSPRTPRSAAPGPVPGRYPGQRTLHSVGLSVGLSGDLGRGTDADPQDEFG
jgi:hypothetical protein